MQSQVGKVTAFLLLFTMRPKAGELGLFGTHPFFSAQEAGGKPAARLHVGITRRVSTVQRLGLTPRGSDGTGLGCGPGIWMFKAQAILRCR